MIRMIQRRLIIPRGDTGSFSIPYLKAINPGDVAVFTIFDIRTKTKMYQKLIAAEGDILNIAFTHGDTVNLKPGKYLWDIKFYTNPQIIDDELVNGDEVDSYYAGFSLPECEIRETGDTLLTSDDAPTSTISPESLNIINAAINEILNTKRAAVEAAETAGLKADAAAESAEDASDSAAAASQSAALAEARVNEIENLSVEVDTGLEGTDASVTYTPSTGVLSFIIPRGNTGNGIASCVLNNDFTLTINYTNGDSTTTIPIRGDTPHLTIGEVTEGPHALATITGTDANPILNLTLPNANVPTKLSQLADDIGVAGKANSADLAAVATSGSYTDLGDKPYIPVKTSDLTNDSNYAVDSNYVHTDNNYTTAEKNKLTGIAAGAEVNVNADWNAASGDAYILNKPTKVSQFTNDAGYLSTETDPTVPAWAKAAQKPSYTAAEVGAPTVAEMNTAIGTAIGNINSFDMAVVQALPTQDISTHTIYLVPKTGETNDVYDEYIYINNAWEMVGNTQIDLSNYALKSELPTKVSELSNDSGYLTSYAETDPTVPQWAKASTKPSYTAAEVGALPSDTHIPTTTAELTNDAGFITVEEVPEVPVQDVQVNGVSVLQDGVANVPIMGLDKLGVAKIAGTLGIKANASGQLYIMEPSEQDAKSGVQPYVAVTTGHQHQSTFYGLAKAAGADMKGITNTTVGIYPDAQKEAIQSMLGITQMLAPENPNLVASQAYSIGDVFAANGHLYKATAAIAQDGAIIPDTNCVETTMAEAGGKIKDVQVAGSSVVGNDGIANVPIASISIAGVQKVNGAYGIASSVNGTTLSINRASNTNTKAGTELYKPIVPSNQHESAFYGLAKAAGADEKDSTLPVGTYTDTAKTAIKNMLGITHTLTVTVLTQDNVTVTGQTVTVRAGSASGKIYAIAAYEGQPVSFSVPDGFSYYVSVSDTLDHHFNPTTASGIVTNTDIAITLQYSDFSSIRTAADIKAALNAEMDLTDLVGEQITCSKGSDTLTWDVVDYDETNKNVTLLLHDVFGAANMIFEPVQALMWCENGLAAGSYTFTWQTTQCYFTLTTAIPSGGQLRATNSQFQTYASQDATATLETGTVGTEEIAGATDLGHEGQGLLNHRDRVNYGSNNFAESALFWWLNSDAAANTSRVPITKFSRAYSYAQPGFMNGLDVNFVNCLDEVDWLCSTNNVYECPESLGGYTKGTQQAYTVKAKFGLASEMEIFGSYGGNADGSTAFDLYSDATADERKKYRGTSAQYWWLRSPNWGYASLERYVISSGSAGYGYATSSIGVVPACRISRTAE